MRRPSRVFWGTAALIVLADQGTKWWAVRTLSDGPGPIEVVGAWARLALVYNPGAAFGLSIGAWSREVFVGLTVLALALLWQLYRTAAPAERGRVWASAFVAGGAVGNLVDRVRSPRGVVDFLDVGIGDARWPTFNVADVAVSCGALALAWVLREPEGDESAAASTTRAEETA